MKISIDDTGRFTYTIPGKGVFYKEDVPPNIDTKNLCNPNKFIPHYLAQDFPVAIEIHPTALCNYACTHCSYGERNKGKDSLAQNVLAMLVESIIKLDIKAVYFSGGGEPTLFPNWDLHLYDIMNEGIECALITNGSKLKGYENVLNRLNYVAISVYSINRETFKKVTGSDNFDMQFHPPKLDCVVGARCVATEENKDEIAQIRQECLVSGYDYFLEVPYVDYEGLLPTNVNHFSVRPCEVLGSTIYVNYDGEVYLCQPLIGQKEYSLGSLYDMSLHKMWEDKDKLIKTLNARWHNNRCTKACRAIAYTESARIYDESPSNVPIEIVKDNFI